MDPNNEMLQEIINLAGRASDFLNDDRVEDKELVEGCLKDALFDLERLAEIAPIPINKEDAVIATALIDKGIDLFINAMVNHGKTKEGIIEQLEIILDNNINAYSNRQ